MYTILTSYSSAISRPHAEHSPRLRCHRIDLLERDLHPGAERGRYAHKSTLDNSSTHKTPPIHRWLVRHPRVHLHFKVDVAFEYPDGQWVMVEVELEGLVENTIGLFQAVKYKALQEAVLRTKSRPGTVIGALVAHRVEREVKAMAIDLGIHIAEVPEA